MQTTALIVNGEIHDLSLIAQRIKTFQRIVAVDGGLDLSDRMGLTPDFLIGDFDSLPSPLATRYSHVPRQSFPSNKNFTDLEAALQQELDHSSSVTIFGGWGGRMDHCLTHALILSRYPGKVRLETETELLFALEKESLLSCQAGQTLSLIPLSGAVSGITTKGLKWELKDAVLDLHFIGISNICLQEKISIRFKTGSLLCALQLRLL